MTNVEFVLGIKILVALFVSSTVAGIVYFFSKDKENKPPIPMIFFLVGFYMFFFVETIVTIIVMAIPFVIHLLIRGNFKRLSLFYICKVMPIAVIVLTVGSTYHNVTKGV